MDYLKKTKDPRIHVYCSLKDGNTEFDKQFGLPNGYDSHTIADAPSGSFVGLENTSNFNINTILRLDAPTTVSYTHLDVYKRQDIDNIRFRKFL